MRIYITDKYEVKKVELRIWSRREKNGWSDDIFADLEVNVPINHPPVDDETDAAMTSAEFKEMVAWWQREVEDYNNRELPNWFCENLSAEEAAAEFAKDLEYYLFIS